MTTLRVLMRGQAQACKTMKSLGLTKVWTSGTAARQQLMEIAPATVLVRHLTTEKEVQDNLKNYSEGNFDKMPDPSQLEHFRTGKAPKKDKDGKDVKEDCPPVGTYSLPHPIWTDTQLHEVKVTHKPIQGKVDWAAYYSVVALKQGFDIFSGFSFGERNERKWLNRICFLETVAGVPGMVAAMMRHMQSLRRLQRDFGWIHTLLEEAENERMHLLTALQLKKPSVLFKISVIGSQGAFVTLFGISYLFSPKFCHRFVGYLEEEAVKTYSKCLDDIDNGPMKHWQTQEAPDVAIRYWNLKKEATMRDVILAIRADEAHHRLVNHTLASMKPTQFNPYKPGK